MKAPSGINCLAFLAYVPPSSWVVVGNRAVQSRLLNGVLAPGCPPQDFRQFLEITKISASVALQVLDGACELACAAPVDADHEAVHGLQHAPGCLTLRLHEQGERWGCG